VTSALAAVVALIFLTELIDDDTDELQTAVQQVHFDESAEVDLLTHFRTTDPVARAMLETDVRSALRVAEIPARDDGERPALDLARQNIEAYFEHPDTAWLESSLAALNRLVAVHIKEAEDARSDASRYDKIGSAVGISVAVLLATLVTVTLFAARSLVLDPIVQLSDAMKRFASGARDVRVKEQGPQEIAAIAQQFNLMSRALARQHEHELTFLAGVAHDLRNPLYALRLSAETIRPDGPLPSEAKFRRIMSAIAKQTKHLERMLNDLLDMARIEAGGLELRRESCDGAELLRDAVDLFRSSTDRHELTLEVPNGSVDLYADPVRLTQVFNNLVSNAIKYSPEGGCVRVAVAVEDGRAIFGVADEGRGIAPEDLSHVFEPFRRGGLTKDEIPGVGVGLSVAKRIVEAHGGRIEVQSQMGIGTIFRVTIPTMATW
jgi:two-component system, OmpR family, sensor histidine kinase MtrB